MASAKTKAIETKENHSPALGQTHPFGSSPRASFAPNRDFTIQQAAGNLALQRLLDGRVLQAELSVSQPTDPYEQEADRIAEQVVSSAPTNIVQRSCAACATGAKCSSCVANEMRQQRTSQSPR